MEKLIVILHNIRSVYNVGAILRTCEGLGVGKVIFAGYTPYPGKGLPHEQAKLTQQIHKTALGAEEMVDWEYVADLAEFIEVERQKLYKVLVLEQAENSVSLRDFRADPSAKYLLILGEEVHGVPAEILAQADQILEIPMRGKKESFNVSVAAGMALWELSRQF